MELSEIGINRQKEKQLQKRGINTVEDLLSYLPRKYNDYTKLTGVRPADTESCFRAYVRRTGAMNAGRMPYVYADCTEEETGLDIRVIWFRSMWLYDSVHACLEKQVTVIGRVTLNETFGALSCVQPEQFAIGMDCLKLYPVYRSVPGMSYEYLAGAIASALDAGDKSLELLPEDIVTREGELPMRLALEYIHRPETMQQAEAGLARVLINDLVYFALHNELTKREVAENSRFCVTDKSLMNQIIEGLPYTLTEDQRNSVQSMVETAQEGKRINSLLCGDVGCGKSICAFLLMAALAGSGYQTVLMAPTQVLAGQHRRNAEELFGPLGIKTAYLDSAMKPKERREVLKRIASGEASVIIGTHSCIGSDVRYGNLALCIVDEEHRFGVKQRAAIVEKAASGVHSVTMSATPIPRSLATVLYGDTIQLNTIRTLPSGRKPVITGIGRSENRTMRFILKEIRSRHQAYVVCPLIERNEALPGLLSVEEVSKRYRELLEPFGVRIGTLTGRDSAEETENTIGRFRSGELDILISTTVIEVGVNVPNATVMVISNAERFGLSSLHQLRGRVGRGTAQAYCVLRTDDTSEKASERLNVLVNSGDGFRIAEEDLRLRGAGDFLGTQQSGENKYVSLMLAHPEEYDRAVRIAKEIILRGPECCTLGRMVLSERREKEGNCYASH